MYWMKYYIFKFTFKNISHYLIIQMHKYIFSLQTLKKISARRNLTGNLVKLIDININNFMES